MRRYFDETMNPASRGSNEELNSLREFYSYAALWLFPLDDTIANDSCFQTHLISQCALPLTVLSWEIGTAKCPTWLDRKHPHFLWNSPTQQKMCRSLKLSKRGKFFYRKTYIFGEFVKKVFLRKNPWEPLDARVHSNYLTWAVRESSIVTAVQPSFKILTRLLKYKIRNRSTTAPLMYRL